MQHLKWVSDRDSVANRQAIAQLMQELTHSAQIKDLADLAAVLSNQALAHLPKLLRRINSTATLVDSVVSQDKVSQDKVSLDKASPDKVSHSRTLVVAARAAPMHNLQHTVSI